jgi:hypothetical protein
MDASSAERQSGWPLHPSPVQSAYGKVFGNVKPGVVKMKSSGDEIGVRNKDSTTCTDRLYNSNATLIVARTLEPRVRREVRLDVVPHLRPGAGRALRYPAPKIALDGRTLYRKSPKTPMSSPRLASP